MTVRKTLSFTTETSHIFGPNFPEGYGLALELSSGDSYDGVVDIQDTLDGVTYYNVPYFTMTSVAAIQAVAQLSSITTATYRYVPGPLMQPRILMASRTTGTLKVTYRSVPFNALAAPALLMGYNGASWDRHRNNEQFSILASAARTASVNSALQTNYNARGVAISFDIDVAPGVDSVQLNVGVYAGHNQRLWLFQGALLTTTGQRIYHIYPGIGAAAANITGTSGLLLGRDWDVSVIHVGSGSFTYSVLAEYMV